MMVVLMIWQTLAFCDSSACSALLDYTWISATTSSTERGGHLDVGAFGFGGLLRVFVVVFGGVFWCVLALVFAPATVSPLVLRPTRTVYCAADVVKRRRLKKNYFSPFCFFLVLSWCKAAPVFMPCKACFKPYECC